MSRVGHDFAVVGDEFPAHVRLLDTTRHLPAVVHRVVGARGVVRGVDSVRLGRVEHDEVRVGPDVEPPLPRQPERAGRVRTHDPDEERQGVPPIDDRLVVEHGQTRLEAVDAERTVPPVVDGLLGSRRRDVVGRDHAQRPVVEGGEHRVAVARRPEGRRLQRDRSERVFDHGERTAREAVADLPDGSWTAVAYADGARRTEELIHLEVTVTVDGGEMVVDFSGSADQVDGPLNVPRGMTESISKLSFKALTTPNRDSNEGQFVLLRVRTREGSIYHPTPPAATGTLWPATLGIDLTFKALAEGMPERVIASTGGDLCNVFFYGTNPETGESFVETSNEAVGWGAASGRDGNNAILHPNQPNTRNTPVEVLETKTGALRVERYVDNDDFAETYLDDVDGWKEDAVRHWTALHRGQYQSGDAISIRSGGGGGYGDPLARPPEAVHEDVLDEYVSRTAAHEVYGVVVTDAGELDREATTRLREELCDG